MLGALAVEGRALEPLQLLALCGVPRIGRRDARRDSARRRRRFRSSIRPARGAASFKGEIAQTRDKIDPSGDVARSRQPRAEDHPRSPAQAADAAARHARVVPARQGHRQVPAGPGRHRAQRPLRAGRQDRAPERIPGHRARRVDERREPVPRAAQHRRNQQRHRRARRAGSRGGPPHPAGADRRVPRPRRRPAAHDRGGDRARRPAGARALLAVDRRRRAAAVDRRRVRAAGGAASAARSSPCRSRSRSCRRRPSC